MSDWFDPDDFDFNDPALLNDPDFLSGKKTPSDIMGLPANEGQADPDDEHESDDDETSSDDDSNNDSGESQEENSDTSPEPPSFDPTAFGLPLDATPDTIKEALTYYRNRNLQQPPTPPAPPVADSLLGFPSSFPGQVTPPQSFLGSGEAGEYETDPRILATIQQQNQVLANLQQQQLEQAQHQARVTTEAAVTAFKNEYGIDDNLMSTIREEAHRTGYLPSMIASSKDPFEAITSLLKMTAFSNPILRDKILNKPDGQAATQQAAKQQKLNSLGGTSKSTRTAPKKPLSPEENDAAMLNELTSLMNS